MTDIRSHIKLVENAAADEQHHAAYMDTGFWGKQAAGCLFMARSTNRILFAKRSQYVLQPHTWGLFGGAIDEGEDPAEAVRREVEEECGFTGSMSLVPLYVFKSDGFRFHNFLGLVDDEFDPILNWENEDAKWVDFGDWPTPLHFGVEAFLSDESALNIIKLNTNNNMDFIGSLNQ